MLGSPFVIDDTDGKGVLQTVDALTDIMSECIYLHGRMSASATVVT